MPKITFDNYPLATVACFDATSGELPRRFLDVQRNNLFLKKLAEQNVSAVLIGASTGQGHVRTPEELDQWFLSTKEVELGNTIKIALLRPEDGPDWHQQHVETLVQAGFDIAFVRPGTNLDADATCQEVSRDMQSACQAVVEADLALGVYSIPDVSGVPLGTDAVADLQQVFGQHLVAVKVTEADYQSSTKKFLTDQRLQDLKIVQGWDPFLANALQDDPVRCGVTSGPMSFAVFQYLHILEAAQRNDWQEVQQAQLAVTSLFQSMQDDPAKFADLQRAKYIMGLGHPLLNTISQQQIERVFAALQQLPRPADRERLSRSLNLMQDGPFGDRLLTEESAA
ncbi:MAG: hypothetical protein CMJ76_13755 [Planctomycetaceae bacterium]|nr:hypothetical protein [Planctomycetaceae bacterium]